MITNTLDLSLQTEAEALVQHLQEGNTFASKNLARLIELDHRGALHPFAEALAARMQDYLERWAELGETDPKVMLEDEVYLLFKKAAIDWDGFPSDEEF